MLDALFLLFCFLCLGKGLVPVDLPVLMINEAPEKTQGLFLCLMQLREEFAMEKTQALNIRETALLVALEERKFA